MSRYRRNSYSSAIGCWIYLAIFLLNIFIGSWSVNFLLLTFLEKTIPTLWAIVIGLFIGEFTIPVAIVVNILQFLGVI